jgi:uncharacterized protein (TIGR02996 family)
MTSEGPLLQAVLARPEDDATRLVYADWLEEHGQGEADLARAELIRLQVLLAREEEDSPLRREQAFRARCLLDQYRKQWLAPFRGCRLHRPLFCRGFLDRARLRAKDLAAHAGTIFAGAPLRRLWLTDLGGKVSVLRRVPASNQLRELDLCGNSLGPEELRALAKLPNLGALRELGLSFTDLGEDGAGVLCEHPFYRPLSLRCGGNPLTEEASERLRERFGERVSFVAERCPDHLYTIQNERFTTGFGRDHTQILCYGAYDRLRLIQFDHAGRLLGHQNRVVRKPKRPATPWQKLPMKTRQAILAADDQAWERTQQAWLEKLGYQPGAILVRRFQLPDGSGIKDYPSGWVEVLERPDDPEWDDAQDWLEDWVARGRFVYDFGGDDWWLNEAGHVTDT